MADEFELRPPDDWPPRQAEPSGDDPDSAGAEEAEFDYDVEPLDEPSDEPPDGASARHAADPAVREPSYDDINATWRAHHREERTRFTLGELMLAISGASISLALVRMLRPSLAAALLGFVVVIGLAVLTNSPHSRVFHLMWWTLLVVYITVAGVAVFQG